ncbi:uncharacterized protein A4U43_C03F21160 [Asparagus officinalis]|uniref:Uncharacterized protein n=1 Tax=Asparagus officinalis TaxID=4686 RepID=A0A5P1FBV7_ASPOF|nr:uncharacterized protein A4U43_C03F21160 [Asparagus officinalis]
MDGPGVWMEILVPPQLWAPGCSPGGPRSGPALLARRGGHGCKGARLSLILALVIGLGSWPFYVAIQPEKPKLCGSDGSPPVTALRIRLRDGRFLAYS